MKIIAFVLSVILFTPLAFADNSGQIINVNQSYQIAFTDLGTRVLKSGDLVKVFYDGENFIYLQVIESSAILSKLGASHVDAYKTSLKDMQRISVGNTVSKFIPTGDVPAPKPVVEQPAAFVPAVNNDAQVKLEQDLEQARLEIRRLQESNKVLAAQVQDMSLKASEPQKPQVDTHAQETLAQVKAKLEHMNRMINQE